MMCCSIEAKDRVIVIGYGFLNFPKNLSRNIGKCRCKNLSIKYIQKFLDHLKLLQ